MDPITVYIHIPYCIKKCPYCDFNSYGIGPGTLTKKTEFQYVQALVRELDFYGERSTWKKQPCRSVFFGGGTPSILSAESITTIIGAIRENFSLDSSAEITLEANPGTIHEKLGCEKLRGFKESGVNRISMGAQSFSADKLKTLGRLHSPEDTVAAVQNIVQAGFDNFNLDLIFGVRDESASIWREDLERTIALDPAHISAYCLTIEPGTLFYQQTQKGMCWTASEELQATLLEQARETLQGAGYEQYEISNFAKPDHTCRHNLAYWSRVNSLGVGAGAHGFLRTSSAPWGVRWSNVPGPTHYIERVVSEGCGRHQEETLTQEQAEIEFFYLGLRCRNGIFAEDFAKEFGEPWDTRYGEVIKELHGAALLEVTDQQLRLSERGIAFSNTVFERFAECSGS